MYMCPSIASNVVTSTWVCQFSKIWQLWSASLESNKIGRTRPKEHLVMELSNFKHLNEHGKSTVDAWPIVFPSTPSLTRLRRHGFAPVLTYLTMNYIHPTTLCKDVSCIVLILCLCIWVVIEHMQRNSLNIEQCCWRMLGIVFCMSMSFHIRFGKLSKTGCLV